jgi:uncharacterized repeat protein (TIGR02543 family)
MKTVYTILCGALLLLSFVSCTDNYLANEFLGNGKPKNAPEPPPNTYTVTFDKNTDAENSTDANPQTATTTYGGTVALPATNPVNPGYVQEGWWTKDGTGGDWGDPFFATTPVTADITVYARWYADQEIYTVIFDKNTDAEDSTDANPQTATTTYGGTVALPGTNPINPGYDQEGWWTLPGPDDWGTQFTATTPVTANLTVYAQWYADNH